ncbi:MAG: HlyD family efflux transporter periplasmic adaptor subunit [Pseudomonadota bacterium]
MSDLSFQVRAPLGLELSTGERLTISDWSLRGFEFPHDSDVLPKEAVLSIPFQGVDIRFPIRLTRDGDSRFLNFDGLSGRQRETLAVFYRSILSGKMASTEDVITSLDTPVDLVPMEETEEEQAAATTGKPARGLRAFFSILLYLCIGAAVFYTLGSGIWSKLARLEIQHARIEAPFIPHLATEGGFVRKVMVAHGQRVSAGEILVEISDPESEAELSEVRGRIDLIEQRLKEAQLREERLAARIARERRLLIAREEARIAVRPTFSFTPQPADRADIDAALEAFDGRFAAGYRDLFEAHNGANEQINSLTDELRRLKRERGRLRDASDARHIMAAEAGTVDTIHALEGQLVGRGQEIVVLEADAARVATGWLDQSMAAAVYPGMEVRVEMAGLEGTQVISGEISQITAGINEAVSPDFGMLLTVTFRQITPEQSRAFPHLAPVSLEARRAWAVTQAGYVARWRQMVGL